MTATGTQVSTPTIGASLKRWMYWGGAAAVIVLIVLASALVRGSSTEQEYFSATDASPVGTRALVEVLRQQGVEVTVTTDLEATENAFDGAGDATLMFYERDVVLDDDQRERALALGADLVLVHPSFDDLDLVAPDIGLAGAVPAGTPGAGCDLRAAEQAETISAEGSGFRILDGAEGATGCFADGEVYSVVQLDDDGTTVTLVGADAALTNEHIGELGNAALALGLLGTNETLVWYIPGPDDLVTSTATLGELSPPWVLPVIGIIGFSFLAAAFWRGRRFGPLIVENLPVTVRASETMLGRARLYASISARLRALDSLRIGTISRIGELCGLPRAATVEEVVVAAAAASGRQGTDVRQLLLETIPQTDSELVALSDDLLELERTVAHNLRPS